jgi:hypothetical protein
VATRRLRSDADLLLAPRLIEPAGANPKYGQVLPFDTQRRIKRQDLPPILWPH